MPDSRFHTGIGLIAVVATCWMLISCGSKESSGASSDAAPEPATASPEAPGASPATAASISAAQSDLKAGRVDDAAAKLAELQVNRASFSAQQAKDYRQVLSDAYDQAIEAAAKGDPKAQAAIQLLRAAAPR